MIDFSDKGIKVQNWVLGLGAAFVLFFLSKIYLDNEAWKTEHSKEEKEYRQEQVRSSEQIIKGINEIKTHTEVQKQFNDYMKENVGRLEKRVEKLEEKR